MQAHVIAAYRWLAAYRYQLGLVSALLVVAALTLFAVPFLFAIGCIESRQTRRERWGHRLVSLLLLSALISAGRWLWRELHGTPHQRRLRNLRLRELADNDLQLVEVPF